MKSVLVLSAIFLILVSCGKDTVQQHTASEIDNYINQIPNLPDFDKECLRNGELKVGMQANTVRFMLGEPKQIKEVKKAWGPQQEWYYKNGGKKVFIIEDGGVVGIEELD